MVHVTSTVGLLDVGPLAVDDQGRVFASLTLVVETDERTLQIELASLELLDAAGARLASMTLAGQLVVTSPGRQRVFDGVVPSPNFSLWSSVRLDATLAQLEGAFPQAYAGVVVVAGRSMPLAGPIPPRGPTA